MTAVAVHPPDTGITRLPASDLLARFDAFPIDTRSVPQANLDLVDRSRTSLFPWRGQFSPEFVEFMLAEYARSDDTVADPFVGSGTTLFEAARRALPAFGAEVNPAAVIMAGSVAFASLGRADRRTRFDHLVSAAQEFIPSPYAAGLFGIPDDTDTQIRKVLSRFLSSVSGDPLAYNAAANLVMRLMDRLDGWPMCFWRALRDYQAIIDSLPFTPALCQVFHCDARCLPLNEGSVQFIITSPPYINVFNYHQNYRPAMEFLGWDVLQIARSEFGSNRKYRANRFLTVIQYAIDMLAALREMRRVLSVDGHLITVIGRESTVRGVPFHNARVVAALAEGAASLRLVLRQERKFTTRFGETIYEDVLHFVPVLGTLPPTHHLAVDVARAVLREAVCRGDPKVAPDIERAMSAASAVQPSPLYKPKRRSEEIPPW
ncbi:MAG: DNA methyltransferase [Armatimonadetes bacterium]|nr:DNA methyltransferase [Armatimonadota bacterium]